jgi:anti-sigma factor RsiW
MEKIPRLSPQRREDLVAYLDGELEEDASREIEKTLAHSPVARHEVEMLTRTFELLDILPPAKATKEFTDQTLATLKLNEARPALAAQPWFQQVRRGLVVVGCLAALSAFATAGFLATHAWVPDESEVLVEDLPVIENIDLYQEVGDIRFLKELQQKGYLHDDPDPEQTE